MLEVAKVVRDPERALHRRAEREIELERQVAECITRLSRNGDVPSQEAIAAEFGKTVTALRKYPSIRRHLERLVQLRRQKPEKLED